MADPDPVDGSSSLFAQLRKDTSPELVAEYATPRVFAWFRRHVSRRDPDLDADDLTQDAMLVVLRAIGGFEMRSEGEFVSWLFRICERVLLTRIRYLEAARRDRRRIEAERRPEDLAAEGPQPESREVELLHAAIDKLPPEQRESLLLDLEGLDGNDAAARLGITRNAHHLRLSRAKKTLRSRLDGITPHSDGEDHES
jgi:RNA polymerase sigma factor (sigma-70 family)